MEGSEVKNHGETGQEVDGNTVDVQDWSGVYYRIVTRVPGCLHCCQLLVVTAPVPGWRRRENINMSRHKFD